MRLAYVILAGCGNQASPREIDAAPAPACLEAAQHDDLAWLQANVFTPSCGAFSACHSGSATQALGLNLENGNTHGALVGNPSKRFTEQIFVVPGRPEASYLLTVVGEQDGPLSSTGTMPPNTPLLCPEKRAALSRWIAAGALP